MVMAAQSSVTYRPVYKALHRPLTVCGVDRRLFFLALLVGVVAFNLFYSFAAGCVLFAALYGCARWSTVHDPQLLPILFRSSGNRRRYDAGKHAAFRVELERTSW
jgi:type IV secretory pathway TrbD component